MLLFSDVLYMLVRHASPSGPMCFRCPMLTLSGPVELLFLLCFIAGWTCVVVSVMLVVCSLSVFLSMCLLVLLLLYAYRDLWKEWGDSNFQIFSQNCQFHHRRLESLDHFNVLLYIILSITVSF